MERNNLDQYYLQVVKEGESPKWPVPEEDLVVGSQPLGSGLVQYWAYPKDSQRSETELPHAEEVASTNTTSYPAIIIDQLEPDFLELVLVKEGHAFGKSESNLANLEDNIRSLIDFAKSELDIEVEHFMTTERVSAGVEQKLDELEGEKQGHKVIDQESTEHQAIGIRSVSSNSPVPANGVSRPSSLLWIAVSIMVIVVLFGGAVIFKDKILAQLGQTPRPPEANITPTPTSTPIPTPTPSVDRSQFKVRVLNGTTKTGAAAKLAETLKSLGWEIIGTGNAANQTTPQTTVSIKGDLEKVSEVLTSDLADEYQATSGAKLKSSDKADIEVIIGKE